MARAGSREDSIGVEIGKGVQYYHAPSMSFFLERSDLTMVLFWYVIKAGYGQICRRDTYFCLQIMKIPLYQK